MDKFPLTLLLLPALFAPLRADYRVGTAEIPAVKIHADAADFAVHPSHPRLFFRDTDIPTIRTRIAGEYQTEWRQMLHHLEEVGLSQRPDKFAVHPHLKNWEIVRNIAFVAAVTGEERYIKWSKAWAAIMAATGPVGNDTEFRGRLQCLAIAYDWLFPLLTAAEKQALEQGILEHIDRAWYFATKTTNYVGGHSRWGNFALTAGLLALVTEHPELREKLLLLRRHWTEGYFPAQSWIARDGGYHMGWAYSAAYLSAGIHYVWSTATNECVFFPWQAKIPWFWIYGRRGDGTFPNLGDAYTVTDDLNAYQSDLLILAAGVLKEPRAVWALKDRTNRFADILYRDKSVAPLAPGDPAAPLALSRHFRNAGMVVARDRWDAKSTVLTFSAPSFYATNHLHRDANAFTLHYRGALAVDSGFYDEGGQNAGGYGGAHWRNYFTRTIAHNAITVFDPAQEMRVLGEPASNDGGQVFREEPAALADIQAGGHAHLEGITRHVETADYTHAAGDATRTYDAERVRLAQREIVYLRAAARAHPVVVVYDRVESAKPEFQKRFLLHTINQPKVRGDLAVASSKGGRLSSLTLLPENAKLGLVGGLGKEAWVDGKNYPWDETSKKLRWRGDGLARWRLEVSPAAPRLRDDFLHVLFVDDDGAPEVGAGDARLVGDTGAVGVEVAGWRITFSREPGPPAKIERLR